MATVIQIKRSAGSLAPLVENLAEAEMAYAQDKDLDGAGAILYIESKNSDDTPAIHKVGGKYYTDIVDAATNLKTANTLAKRDALGAINADVTGNVTGDLTGNSAGTHTGAVVGNADTASAWATPRKITLAGDVSGEIILDGSGDVTSTSLEVTGATATSLTGNMTGDVLSEDGLVTILDNGTDGSDATYKGDILSNDGLVTILDNGTDGTDAAFIGAVTGNVTGDLTGNSAGTHTGAVVGNASTATALQTSRNFSATGADVSAVATGFDGTGNVELAMVLSTTGVTAGSVGSATEIPIITVDDRGRVTSTGTSSISTHMFIAADIGTDDQIDGGETLTISGTVNEVQTTVTDNGIQVGFVANPTIGGNLTVSGDLTVSGTTTQVNTTNMAVEDSLVAYATNNIGAAGDAIDIGFTARYNDGATDRTTGFFRDANDGKYHLFVNSSEEVTGNVVDKTNADYQVATLVANLTGNVTGDVTGNTAGTHTGNVVGNLAGNVEGNLTLGRVHNLSQAIDVADGGTGVQTFTTKGILFGNGTGALQATTAGQVGQVLVAGVGGLPTFGGIDGGTF
jgi:trimeric autotransporter adhesin